MKVSLSNEQLLHYVVKQLDYLLPDGYVVNQPILMQALNLALQRCEKCFCHIAVRGYCEHGEALFSHLHSDQYSTFLYFLMNSCWRMGAEKQLCDKIMNLQRIISGCFVSYKCGLPDIFYLNHPVGTVIGNANYSDYLVVFQNVTVNTHAVGQNGESDLFIGKGVCLCSGAKIIGGGQIGDRVSLGINSIIYNKSVPNDNVVHLTEDGKCVVEKRKRTNCAAQEYFNIIL